MSRAIPVRPKDRVCFQCSQCAECCRNIEGELMLTPLDAYWLARLLREQRLASSIDAVYERYAHTDLLEGCLPIYLMNTVGDDHACVFLRDGRCSVYKGRPQTCRIYPFFTCPGECGKAFETFQCMDRHASHFTGGKVLVKDWLHENFSEESCAFMTTEATLMPELGGLLRRLGADEIKACMVQTLHYRYYSYDLDGPFMPQYTRNMKALMRLLRNRSKGV